MRRGLLIVACALLLGWAVYRRAPTNFLRAESGWYLQHAYAEAEVRRGFEQSFFRTSYGGHYTPLLFLAEFRTARLIGTNATLWLGRQIAAVALIGAVAFAVSARVGSTLGLSARHASIMAAAIAAVSAFQPAMLDFIAWPFMLLQLVWIGFVLLALDALVRLVSRPEQSGWAWVAALSAYGSMHASGLGAALVAAVALTLGGLLMTAQRQPNLSSARHVIVFALGTMLCLAILHGLAMVRLLPEQAPPPGEHSAGAATFLKLLLGFFANFTAAGMSTFVAGAFAEVKGKTIAYCWPYGLLLLALIVAGCRWLWRKAARDTAPHNLTAWTLHAFSAAGVCALVAMIGARELMNTPIERMGTQLAHYLSVPRYLVPLHFVLLGSVLHGAVALTRKMPRFAAVTWCGVAGAALLAQVEFQSSAYKHVAPLGRISHAAAWKNIREMVRECRAAGLPVPDASMDALVQEFSPARLGQFEPLLRYDLRLQPGEIQFAPWEEFLRNPERYEAVPRLPRVRRFLRLDEE